MNNEDPKKVVQQFNHYINTRDIDGLSKLMSPNHVFIDSENNSQRGKEVMIKVWTGFFQQFPDYQNYFSKFNVKNNCVYIVGHSTCSFKPLDGPAIWTASVKNGLIEEWRVYDDTTENRSKFNLET